MHGTLTATQRARVVRRCDNMWTYAESEILRKFWPSMEAIRERIPHRTELAIRYMAKRCGLVPDKVQHIWTAAQDRILKRMAASGATRKEMAEALGLTVVHITNRLQYTKTTIAKRAPILVGDPLVDAIRRRAFDLKITMADLDRSLGWANMFRSPKRHPPTPRALHEAIKALGGNLVVEWIDE